MLVLRLGHTLKPLKFCAALVDDLPELVVPDAVLEVDLVLNLDDLLGDEVRSGVYLVSLLLLE